MTRESEIEIIRCSPLFDAEWYLSVNDDVAKSGRDPAIHYYDDGAREGRDPSPNFSTSYYSEKYIANQLSDDINPLVHFETTGRREEYQTIPDDYWLLSRDPQKIHEYQTIEASGQFDKKWYIEKYLNTFRLPPDPIAHYLIKGAKLRYNPGPNFDTEYYLKHNPDVERSQVDPLLHYLTSGQFEGRIPVEPVTTLSQFIIESNPQRVGLRIYSDSSRQGRVYLLTDSLNSKSFFGGVGTALLLVTILARRLDATLVFLVRGDDTQLHLYDTLLKCHDVLPPNAPVEVVNVERSSGLISYSSKDLFFSTSWWSTRCLIETVPSRQIFYIIQEDERLFYPHSNLHLNAAEILNNSEITFIVNSRLLYDHFLRTMDNSVAKDSLWFEPAFPIKAYYSESRNNTRRTFSFYARPKADRNLFVRGIEVIDRCLSKGYFDDDWDIVFIGNNIPKFEISSNGNFITLENLSWDEYLKWIRKTDLGLTLMYTPHPSYPPLDIASCGGIAVTNSYGNKLSFDRYSRNVICSSPDIDSLINGIRIGIALVSNTAEREKNFADQKLCRTWDTSLSPVIERLVRTYHA